MGYAILLGVLAATSGLQTAVAGGPEPINATAELRGAHAADAGGPGTAPAVDAESYPWSVGAVAIAVMLGMCCGCCQAFCCCIVAYDECEKPSCRGSFMHILAPCAFKADGGYEAPDEEVDTDEDTDEEVDTDGEGEVDMKVESVRITPPSDGLSETTEETLDQTVKDVVYREMRLMALLPIVSSLLAWSGTTCTGGPPTWIYLVYLPIMVRAKSIEWCLLKRLGADWSFGLAFNFILGILDHMDFFTDGIFPLQCLRCEPEITAAYVATFETSNARLLAPAIAWARFGGIAAVVLAAAVLAQQAVPSSEGPGVRRDAAASVAADVPGFAALSDFYDKKAGVDAGFAPMLITVSKVLVENVPQLYLQASYLGLTWSRLAPDGRVKIAVSLAFGMLGGTLKCLKTTKLLIANGTAGGRPELILSVLCMIPQVLILGALATIAFRVYFTFTCPQHQWNLTTMSCVGEAA